MTKEVIHTSILPHVTRRQALERMGSGFGMVALASLLGDHRVQAFTDTSVPGQLGPKATHFPAKAKHVIFLFLNGGMSQVDTFDPKPMLDKYHGHPMPGENLKTSNQTGSLMRSPFSFKRCGQSGIEVSDIFPHVGESIDDICVIRSVYTDLPAHEPSLMLMNCGHIQLGRPSMGSWVTYGLGSENQNLPGFVVLCPGTPIVGPPLWNSAFLPGIYQGTHISNAEKEPEKLVKYIRNKRLSLSQQRKQVALLAKLGRLQMEQQHDRDPQLEASIQSMEVAYHMQTEVPEVFDIGKEDDSTRARYGNGDFGRACLMALRLVERGVRVVQIYSGNVQPWDNHEDIMVHQKLAREADQPVASLLRDLKARGLLGETLVICGTEFGRTPVVQATLGSRVANGRDHNPYGFSIWLAGGGIKGGMTYGSTDDFGFKAVENPVHIHDVHATILHLLGLNHEKLTYRYSGRDFRLTDVSGSVIKQVIA